MSLMVLRVVMARRERRELYVRRASVDPRPLLVALLVALPLIYVPPSCVLTPRASVRSLALVSLLAAPVPQRQMSLMVPYVKKTGREIYLHVCRGRAIALLVQPTTMWSATRAPRVLVARPMTRATSSPPGTPPAILAVLRLVCAIHTPSPLLSTLQNIIYKKII
jgi:hypothetical protein